jgi:hypothetical protein
MSLNFNLTGIKDYKTVCWEPDLHPENADFEGLMNRQRHTDAGEDSPMVMTWLCHILVIISMRVGLGTITEANAQEWHNRVYILERMGGAFLNKRGEDGKQEPMYISYEDIKRHIGLTTNVSNESVSAWNASQMRIIRQDAARSRA